MADAQDPSEPSPATGPAETSVPASDGAAWGPQRAPESRDWHVAYLSSARMLQVSSAVAALALAAASIAWALQQTAPGDFAGLVLWTLGASGLAGSMAYLVALGVWARATAEVGSFLSRSIPLLAPALRGEAPSFPEIPSQRLRLASNALVMASFPLALLIKPLVTLSPLLTFQRGKEAAHFFCLPLLAPVVMGMILAASARLRRHALCHLEMAETWRECFQNLGAQGTTEFVGSPWRPPLPWVYTLFRVGWVGSVALWAISQGWTSVSETRANMGDVAPWILGVSALAAVLGLSGIDRFEAIMLAGARLQVRQDGLLMGWRTGEQPMPWPRPRWLRGFWRRHAQAQWEIARDQVTVGRVLRPELEFPEPVPAAPHRRWWIRVAIAAMAAAGPFFVTLLAIPLNSVTEFSPQSLEFRQVKTYWLRERVAVPAETPAWVQTLIQQGAWTPSGPASEWTDVPNFVHLEGFFLNKKLERDIWTLWLRQRQRPRGRSHADALFVELQQWLPLVAPSDSLSLSDLPSWGRWKAALFEAEWRRLSTSKYERCMDTTHYYFKVLRDMADERRSLESQAGSQSAPPE